MFGTFEHSSSRRRVILKGAISHRSDNTMSGVTAAAFDPKLADSPTAKQRQVWTGASRQRLPNLCYPLTADVSNRVREHHTAVASGLSEERSELG